MPTGCTQNRLNINNDCIFNAIITECGNAIPKKVLIDMDLGNIGTGSITSNANNTFTGTNTFSGSVTLNGNNIIGNAPTDTLSFFGSTPVVRQTLATYTTDTESVAYTGVDNTQSGTVYAKLTDLQALRLAYENLRTSYDDMRTKLLTTGLIS